MYWLPHIPAAMSAMATRTRCRRPVRMHQTLAAIAALAAITAAPAAAEG
jgi:hypothetical protein